MNHSLMIAVLPDYLQSIAKLGSGTASWPLNSIPLVIEAYRQAGMINRGGDLQIIVDDRAWESPNFGVWVFDSDLIEPDPRKRPDEAAGVALSKLAGLDHEAMREEVLAGCPFFTESAFEINRAALRLTWRAEPIG
ncbi:hypothetical protein [Caulobacter sp. BP25]|uniref:hypothetical protein n=1 Tax=Caulobacter sp. BP25 TaxID=2048900 RepID=UPI000C129ECB|nr:hypothetical protein [Caulobacter sp. BP25]PHY17934.1 hypothetical protein CSW59_14155 [Caulobacter sp. BP25]